MKKFVLMLMCIVFVVCSCQRGPNPKDSLIATGNAILNYDTDNIDKYVDLTSVINDMIDVVAKQDSKDLPEFDVKQMVAMKAIFVPMVKQYILGMYKELEKTEYNNYVKAVKVKEYKILSNKDGVASAEVKFDFGDLAALLPNESTKTINKEVEFVFEMKQKDDYWQIVKISNLEEKMSKYKDAIEEQIKQRKAEQALKEPRNMLETICQAQKMYYFQNGIFAAEFEDLNMRFKDKEGKRVTASGRSFTNKGVTYLLSTGGKVYAIVSEPKKYSLVKDCDNNGKIDCKDNGSGICKKIGL